MIHNARKGMWNNTNHKKQTINNNNRYGTDKI